MFDFLKKSRAVKFLCSACLLCSLGSFAVSAAETTPAKIADVYVRAELGNATGKITLANATMDTAGQLSGTLQLKTAEGYEAITNTDEDAKITLFLAASNAQSDGSQLAVSDAQSLAQKNYALSDVQFYASSSGKVLGEAKEEKAANYAPSLGKFSLWGIVSDPGSKSLISGPKTSS